jgi:ferredoxin
VIGRKRPPARHQLSVDNDHCRRYGFCVAEAPELFELTTSGGLRYRRIVAQGQLEAARAAARICPTLAITLAEAESPTRGRNR